MMERKELGFVQKARFGLGGYQDVQFGLHLQLGGPSWGVGHTDAFWPFEPTAGAQWTVGEQTQFFGDLCRRISKLLGEAKVDDVASLKGKPVECVFEGNSLKSWRLLTEVIP